MCRLPCSGLQDQHVPMQSNQQQVFIGQVLKRFAGFGCFVMHFGCHAPYQFELLYVSLIMPLEKSICLQRSTDLFVLIWLGLAGVSSWRVEMVRDAIVTSYKSCSFKEKQLALSICVVDGQCFAFWITLKLLGLSFHPSLMY